MRAATKPAWMTMLLVASNFPPPAAAADLVLDTGTGPYVEARLNGVTLRLKVQLDHEAAISLNPAAAARAGLGRGQGKSIMKIGPMTLTGRFANAELTIDGTKVPAQLNWYNRDAASDADGTISPILLPFDAVRLETGQLRGPARTLSFATRVDKNHGIFVPVAVGGQAIAVRFSLVRQRSTSPAAAAAVLAQRFGGTIEESSLLEEIGFGVKRPVRQLRLSEPFTVGPLPIPALWVRVTDFRGDHQLPPTRPADNGVILVEGAPKSQKSLYRITLGSDVLNGCVAATYQKESGRLSFTCPAAP